MPRYVALTNIGITPWGPKFPKGAEVPANHPTLQQLLKAGLVQAADSAAPQAAESPEATTTVANVASDPLAPKRRKK